MADEIGQGIALCDYLVEVFQRALREEAVWEFPSDRAKHMDRESLLASGVTLDRVARVRQQLVEVLQGQPGEAIEGIQQFLVRVTMPMWARRTREWREARRRRWISM